MKVQISSGKTYEVDTTHALTGKAIQKKANCGMGMVGRIVGIRAGAKATDLFAFIVEYPGQCHLIGRRDFKVIN